MILKYFNKLRTYNIACAIYDTEGINFDIHPGNFIWSKSKKQWFLVDLGPMPRIGADYFPRKNFQEYFQKIWLDLHGLMITVPIRSLDIQMNPEQFSDIVSFISSNIENIEDLEMQ